RIIALKPGLVVAWKSGSPTAQVEKLKALGIPVFDSEPRDIEGIATSIERLAHLAGTEKTGHQQANSFRERIRQLESNYRSRPKVRVFYQIWNDPLMTLNGNHLVSSIVRLCGGENIYAHLPQLTPSIEEAAVLKANPEVIISGDKGRLDTLIQWKRFKRMTAVVRNNLFTVDADAVARSGPRVADGAEAVCRHIDEARQKRK
ncbi:MAG: btuF, partial [Paucimonas sp.]|nr:btuF [Paucimonas sp.]